MKTIIAGTRDYSDYRGLWLAIQELPWKITEVLSGGCLGVDQLGEIWARSEQIPCVQFKPDWGKHGKAAGPIRNREMAQNAEALLAIWDGKSKGTKNMIDTAIDEGLRVQTYSVSSLECSIKFSERAE